MTLRLSWKQSFDCLDDCLRKLRKKENNMTTRNSPAAEPAEQVFIIIRVLDRLAGYLAKG